MNSLVGKRCTITGGSRGIGLAIAQLFAAEGATCTLIGRDPETLASAKESLRKKKVDPQKHDIAAFDVASAQGWEDLIARMEKNESADILVNAAGASQSSLLSRTPAIDIDKLIATNLMGTVWSCKYFVPKMMKQGSGCIINVSSLLATHGGRGSSVYAASKAGVVGLTRAMASEVGRFGIRTNVLLPGYIQTDMTKGMDQNGKLSALIPLGRLGLVEEVAEAALFLAKSTYAHNCVLNIDGGLSAT
ncbi:NAD(P)-binding protein [Rostrohypoxylon terebratum]|nr:NAD(P)-binding protein [Rostrohypoxylon terebratum]